MEWVMWFLLALIADAHISRIFLYWKTRKMEFVMSIMSQLAIHLGSSWVGSSYELLRDICNTLGHNSLSVFFGHCEVWQTIFSVLNPIGIDEFDHRPTNVNARRLFARNSFIWVLHDITVAYSIAWISDKAAFGWTFCSKLFARRWPAAAVGNLILYYAFQTLPFNVVYRWTEL